PANPGEPYKSTAGPQSRHLLELTMKSSCLLAIAFVTLIAAEDSGALGGFPTSINGNLGVVGSGYGDMYGGKIKEGVYGVGGRVGGNVGLVGSAGLGRKRRQAAALNGASASAGAVASGPDAFSVAGAAAGTGSLSFGGWPGIPTVAPPSVPAATAKPCPKRRRRTAV
ncbi:hypothetical protein PRIPAC_91279, partial [Pristionchus pacificus]|uniref:Uncharacterized protein n=1 Tax=Pristionchus pacificus TaxID=54126 RepID=A0A2A6CY55_PRIPA